MAYMYTVYRIVNKVNGKCYVGQTSDLEQRISNHMYSLRRGIHSNYRLQADYNEYGLSAFEVEALERGIPQIDSYVRERYWMRYFKSEIHGYNIIQSGGGINYDHSPELSAITTEIVQLRHVIAEKLSQLSTMHKELDELKRIEARLKKQRRQLRKDTKNT
jgi:group I intron endonuclease